MTQQIERRLFALTPEIPVSLEQRDESEGLPRIVGYTAVFGVDTEINSYFGTFKERLQKGAFRRAIREGQDVRALRNHDPDNLLGRTNSKTLRLKEDDTGLHIDVDPPNTSIGRDTVESIRRGDLSGMSFAFIVRKEKWINGEDGSPDVRIIQDVDLFDVGPVTFPAYASTTADLRSNSAAYQVGLAELGRPVPRLPKAEMEKKAENPGEEIEVDPPTDAPKEDAPEVVDEVEDTLTELEDEPIVPEPDAPKDAPEPEQKEAASGQNFRQKLRKARAEGLTNQLAIDRLESSLLTK